MLLRVSSSIAPFREKAEKTWKLERYKWPRDMFKKVRFFGMYHIGDYIHYMAHFGEKEIVWAGSDILNLLDTKVPWEEIFGDAIHYCENEVEQKELRSLGIEAKIVYTFLEDVNNFPISYKQSKNPVVYISTRIGREDEYGLGLVEKMKEKDIKIPGVKWCVFDGTAPPDCFNKMIKGFHCGFRPLEHDGFSEIIAKSALMGQWPISRIKYPYIDSYETEEELIALLKELPNKKEPNYEAAKYYREKINKF